MEQDNNHLERQVSSWYQTHRGLILRVLCSIAALAFVWVVLWWYIAPKQPEATQRKDLVIACAALVAATGGVGTLYVGWRNMRIAQDNTTQTLENTRKLEEERAREEA